MKIIGKMVSGGNIIGYMTNLSTTVYDKDKMQEIIENGSCENAVVISNKVYLMGEVKSIEIFETDMIVNNTAEPIIKSEGKEPETHKEPENKNKEQKGQTLFNDIEKDSPKEFKGKQGSGNNISALSFGANAGYAEPTGEKKYYEAVLDAEKNYVKGNKSDKKPKVGVKYFDENDIFHKNDFQPNFSNHQMLFGVSIYKQYVNTVNRLARKVENESRSGWVTKDLYMCKYMNTIAKYIASVVYPINTPDVIQFIALTKTLTMFGCDKVAKVVDREKDNERREELISNGKIQKCRKQGQSSREYRIFNIFTHPKKIIRHSSSEKPVLGFEYYYVRQLVSIGNQGFDLLVKNQKKSSWNPVVCSRYEEFMSNNDEYSEQIFKNADSIRNNKQFVDNDYNGSHYIDYENKLNLAKIYANKGNDIYSKRIRLSMLNLFSCKDDYGQRAEYAIEYVLSNRIMERFFMDGVAMKDNGNSQDRVQYYDNGIMIISEIMNSINVEEFIKLYKVLVDFCNKRLQEVKIQSDRLELNINLPEPEVLNLFNDNWMSAIKNSVFIESSNKLGLFVKGIERKNTECKGAMACPVPASNKQEEPSTSTPPPEQADKKEEKLSGGGVAPESGGRNKGVFGWQ